MTTEPNRMAFSPKCKQIISYIFTILKHIKVSSQFIRQVIDAESLIIIFFYFFFFFFFLGGGGGGQSVHYGELSITGRPHFGLPPSGDY